jgi:tRNA(Ile)-lysidine synthase
MNNFARNFLTEWRKLSLPFEGEAFVAAVSGGADSVALLLALEELQTRKKLKNTIFVAHFNHDLRGKESEKDAEFVADLARKFGFEFVCKTAKPLKQKGNLEQNARNARYRFLRETAENHRARGVLTAHTLDDQAETFLLNLIRGSGLEGLGGMKTVRGLESEVSSFKSEKSKIQNPKSRILLIRPLLNWARRGDTEDFCRSKKIEYRTDSMNLDERFARVRIRKKLLPFLEDLNPKIVEILAKTAWILREDFEELQKNTEEKTSASNELQLKEIKILTPSARSRVLRAWLKTNRGDLRRLGAKHFEAVERLIFSRKSGKTVELPDLESVEKRNGKLIFQRNRDLLSINKG